jgi:hypothetical protein
LRLRRDSCFANWSSGSHVREQRPTPTPVSSRTERVVDEFGGAEVPLNTRDAEKLLAQIRRDHAEILGEDPG